MTQSPPPPALDRPKLRGILHLVSAPLSLAAGIFLVWLADGTVAKVGSAVFILSALNLFTVSATYHIGRWSVSVKRALRRVDHSNIFVIIAGTYTPLSLVLLPTEDSTVLLVAIWLAAGLGVGLSAFWPDAPRWVSVPIYLGMGWASVFYVPAMLASGGGLIIGLVALGGLLYTAGAIVYGLKRPNFSHRWFGFHELFHAFTVAAFAAHFAAVALAVS